MIAESMAVIGPCMNMFVGQLLPLLISWSQDPSGEVRNNAIYAIGELAFHGKEAVYPYPFNIYKIIINTKILFTKIKSL